MNVRASKTLNAQLAHLPIIGDVEILRPKMHKSRRRQAPQSNVGPVGAANVFAPRVTVRLRLIKQHLFCDEPIERVGELVAYFFF